MTNQTQYREVARKAAVGELIKIVAATGALGNYANGDVYEVTEVDRDDDVWFIGRKGRPFLANPDEYAVLEPVASAAAPQEPDALTAAFRQFVLDNADAIRAILPTLETQLSAEPPVRKAQPKALTRAEIIAKATADVAELLTQNHPGVGGEGAWFTNADGRSICDRADFVVNREKRTVAALLRYVVANTVWRRATAKAAPDDVFHAEIGKAIALRRALGLAVPDEYVNAPKPEEPQVGAIVSTVRGGADWNATLTGRCYRKDGGRHGQAWEHSHDSGWIGVNQFDVIDDTDVDYDAVPAKEAA